MVALVVVGYVGMFVGYNMKIEHVLATSNINASMSPSPAKSDLYDLWLDVNKVRAKHSLKPLSMSVALTNSAQAKCEDMVQLD